VTRCPAEPIFPSSKDVDIAAKPHRALVMHEQGEQQDDRKRNSD